MCSHIYFSVDDRQITKTILYKYDVKGTVTITPDAIAMSTALLTNAALASKNDNHNNQFSIRNSYTDRMQNHSDPGGWPLLYKYT